MILGVGEVTLDLNGCLTAKDENAEKHRFDEMVIEIGGCVYNQLRTIMALGGSVGLVTDIGNDVIAELISDLLPIDDFEEVVIHHTCKPGNVSLCMTQKQQKRRDIFARFQPAQVDELYDSIGSLLDRTDLITIDGSYMEALVPFMEDLVRNQREIPVWIDCGSVKAGLLTVLPYCSYRMCSAYFMRQLGYGEDMKAGLLKLFGPKNGTARLAGVTLGEQGSLFFDGQEYYHCNAIKAEAPVDLNGCGDVFNGALVYSLCVEHTDLRQAAEFATELAGYNIGYLGRNVELMAAWKTHK